MKMKKLFFLLTVCLLMASCGEKDLYDPNFDLNYSTYVDNFSKKYGKINPTQEWDFSTDNAVIQTRAAENIEISAIAGLDFKFTKTGGSLLNPKYSIKQNVELYNNVIKSLPENMQHDGEVVVLTAPSNSFMLYPVSVQGAYTYDLMVKVGDEEPVKVFSKTWSDYSKPYINGNGLSTNDVKSAPMNGVKVEAPVGTPIQIYLANIKSGNNIVTDKLIGTGTGNAIFVNGTAKPEGLGNVLDVNINDAMVKYIGIEDSPTFGDRDFNDIIVAIVGNPYVPQDLVITEEIYVLPIGKPAKRYMIEDLGATDDFDFNDIVVDVMDIIEGTYKTTITNGVITSNELIKTTHYQTATIKHLGGTLPFKIKVGNTTLPEIAPAIGLDPNITCKIEGWIPNENNITVVVGNKKNENVHTIEFPKTGSIPMIIAFDTYKQWMEERVSIPQDWLK